MGSGKKTKEPTLVLNVISDDERTISIARWSFPVWKVKVNGLIKNYKSSKYGTIEVKISSGHSRIEIWHEPPRLRKYSYICSVFFFIVWVLIVSKTAFIKT